MRFHPGELAVQQRAGVEFEAGRVGRSIQATIPRVAADFVARQPMAIVGYADSSERIWASVLCGAPGSFNAADDRSVEIAVKPIDGDPLSAVWHDGLSVGLLFIELETRRRMRVNGTLSLQSGDSALVSVSEVYANCPKYIQAREWEEISEAQGTQSQSVGRLLSGDQQSWISRADTFFIATSNPQGGADASHRGGAPGFVHVESPDKLVIPDFAGNNMFNTLGNLSINPKAGLLFINFTTGTTLQITGSATVRWDSPDLNEYPGAQRLVEFSISKVIQTEKAVGLKWNFVSESPFNPS